MILDIVSNLGRERRAIYNPGDPMHRNRDARVALWKDIAAEIIFNTLVFYFLCWCSQLKHYSVVILK